MKKLGLGKGVDDLQKNILALKEELQKIERNKVPLPELINSANLLRANESLIKSDLKKTDLLDAYENYSSYLEQVIGTLLGIQNDLKTILREQAEMIEKSKSKKLTKSKK